MNEMVPNQQNLIIYNTLDGKVSVTMMARDGNVWMNQKQMAELFATSKQNVGQHISNILKENELTLDSVVKNFFITAEEISVVLEGGRPIKEVSECKESLPTASTCASIAQAQKESNVHFMHIGASLKDLGKKLFAFSKLEISPEVILNVISK